MVNYSAVGHVGVVVMMLVNGKGGGSPATEQSLVLVAERHALGRAVTADMAVEADNTIGRRHDDMQIV
jgi:hypothetical protein